MKRDAPASFSRWQRWSISFNVALSTLAVLAIVAMVNYLAARHFTRFAVGARAQTAFSPITKRTLASLTNDVKIIVYFDKIEEEAMYDSVWSLLKEYKFANSRITIETVDPIRDRAASEGVKAKYQLSASAENPKNLIIFDCNKRYHVIYEGELSELDIKPLISGQSREIRRTHFKGEMLFTSALQKVTSSRALKACFLQGHGEHRPESDDRAMGYSKFAGVLKENNVRYESLSLLGKGEIPADCNLLIIPAPANALRDEEVEKIDRYLKQGGRLMVLFSCFTLNRPTGLEKLLERWGVAVGNNVVRDRENSWLESNDILVSRFSDHPITKPLMQTTLYMVLPRSIGKLQNGASSADAPQVVQLARTGPQGRVITDIGDRLETRLSPTDFIGEVPVMAAVEKGTIPGVSADRGSTRILVVGDSVFLANGSIDNVANHDFASHGINWLLARNELLLGLAPRPIKEYKLALTQSKLRAVSWILLAGMPGSVLLLGGVVWFRRRK
jgi:hypothetical protein